MNWTRRDKRTWDCKILDLFEINIDYNDSAWDWYIHMTETSEYNEEPFRNGREATADSAKEAVKTALRDISLDLVQALD